MNEKLSFQASASNSGPTSKHAATSRASTHLNPASLPTVVSSSVSPTPYTDVTGRDVLPFILLAGIDLFSRNQNCAQRRHCVEAHERFHALGQGEEG